MSGNRGRSIFLKEVTIANFNVKVFEILLVLSLVALYFITRLYHLTSLPVFCDEAIYVRWAQVMRSEQTLRFLPLSDGKQPLFMWLVIPFLKIFSDPLYAGRITSAFFGVLTLSGLLVISLILGNKRQGLLSMLLYVIVPFGLFFDRMALADSQLSAFGLWSLVLSILLGKTGRTDVAMILGMVLGGALLTKSPGQYFLILSPVTIIATSMVLHGFRWRRIIWTAVLSGIVIIMGWGIYNILRLGPNFQMIALRNKDYLWPVSEIIKHPLDPFWPHLKDIFRYFWSYVTWPLLAVGIFGFVKMFFSAKNRRNAILLSAWAFLPILAQAGIAKVFTARYILFSFPALVYIVSFGIDNLLNLKIVTPPFRRRLVYFGVCLLFIPSIIFDWKMWKNPSFLPLPQDERRGYLEEWTSGWGIKDIADEIRNMNRADNIIVGTEGFFGTLPDGLQIYLEKVPRVTVIGVGYPVKTLPESLKDAKRFGNKVYLVVNRSRLEADQKEIGNLLRTYEKPGGDALLFFEI